MRSEIAAAIVLTFAYVGSAAGQGGPTLTISVVDPTGAVMVGAHVTVTGNEAPLTADTAATGAARFVLPASGRYAVHVTADGFEPADMNDLSVRRDTARTVKLRLARVYETVDVGRDPRDRASDPRSDVFATILGAAEIRELPDDVDEMERVLRDMAGPGAVLRVNGFRGGRLPPKDQIAQIRFHRNMFAADAHEAGFMSVDIITKPGLEGWRGATGVGFRDSEMNARNAFAPSRGDERYARGAFNVSGPLWRRHTSIALSADGTSAYDSQTVLAAQLSGLLSQVVRRPNDASNGSVRIEHALTSSQQLRFEAQRNHTFTDDLGVGTFDLPERGYRQTTDGQVFRGSVSGGFGRRFYNDVRLSWQSTDIASASALQAPTVVVLNAFTSGGAQIDGTRSAAAFEAADDLDISQGRHAVRTGVLVESQRLRTTEQRNALGTFTFASLDAYARQQPTAFTRTLGDPRASASQVQLGTYVQDDIRVSHALMLSVGVRQESQSQIGGLNLAPRGGVAWSPTRSGRTTVRAGSGIFFDWFDAQEYLRAVQLDGTHQQIETVLTPSYPAVPTPSTGGVLTGGRVQFASSLDQPRLHETNAGVEQSFGSVRLNAMVVHRTGSHLLRGIDVNAPDASGRRPDPAAGPITEIRSIASSRFDALNVNLNLTRPEQHVFIAAHYMLSRSMNDTDSPLTLPADAHNLAAEWGPAADAARHRATAFASFPLAHAVTAGVSVNARSALPYDITTGRDDNGDSLSSDRPAGVSGIL